MRYIPIDEIAVKEEIQNFEIIAANYLQQMTGMSDKKRKEFIKNHVDWNVLQETLYNLSETKCWYSEAPPGAGDYEIDHFRPKNRSKQYDGTILRKNGYWWLAYNWRNYRLAGGLINKRRKDRMGANEEVKGKGDYFPLDIDNGSIIANIGDNLNHELPVLLDPTNLYDVSLITFDKNGQPILPAGISNVDRFRAEKSIFFYHLDLEQLNYYRSQVWNKCEELLKRIHEAVVAAANEHAKRAILETACADLIELTRKKAPFSMTAWACIDANTEKYVFWLKNIKKALH